MTKHHIAGFKVQCEVIYKEDRYVNRYYICAISYDRDFTVDYERLDMKTFDTTAEALQYANSLMVMLDGGSHNGI